MESLDSKKSIIFLFVCLWIAVGFILVSECSVNTTMRWDPSRNSQDWTSSPPLKLHRYDKYVVMDNGMVNVTLSNPSGMVTRIQYNGVNNILSYRQRETSRGYWDVVWSDPQLPRGTLNTLAGTRFQVIVEDENQIEISFLKTWDSSRPDIIHLNVDKRFIMMRGSPGFYSYAIFEHLEGWPDLNIVEARIAFKLQEKMFHYMALSDDRQRFMASAQERKAGQVLAYKEAVLITTPTNPNLKGKVDDKYQYSSNNKDIKVHGWISSDESPVGFWVITPSREFCVGGPMKQELTSHNSPVSLSVFFSGHYTGGDLAVKLRDGEHWKKVFGPVFFYLNSASPEDDHPLITLWQDAKEQMVVETKSWPYNFPRSKDFPHADQRGAVSGRLLVQDRYINKELISGRSAYVVLAPPGDLGAWQRESKGYQFWNETDDEGNFLISGVRPGNYNLYAWVTGFIGDYKYDDYINITPGSGIMLGDIVYYPPRTGPTLWEIGIPDRTAAEFFMPDPKPQFMNQLSLNHSDKFRQYGLWDRYTDLYPEQDLIYTVGVSNHQTDWFFAHVNRKVDGHYVPTTWQILFDLGDVDLEGTYTLRIAIASANGARFRVWINSDPSSSLRHFTTNMIGRDNAIARHGSHGLYWLYNVEISASLLQTGRNAIFIQQQSNPSSSFTGFLYDYIRLEGPGGA